jgi:hypothetical protein
MRSQLTWMGKQLLSDIISHLAVCYNYKAIIIQNDGPRQGEVSLLGQDTHRIAPDCSLNRRLYLLCNKDKVIFGAISGYVGSFSLETKKTTYFEHIDEELIRGVID